MAFRSGSVQVLVAAALALAGGQLSAQDVSLVQDVFLAQDVLLTNGRFVEPDGESIFEGHLHLSRGVVAARLTEVPDGFTGDVVDLQGRFVIPGLRDMHTHSFGNTGPGGVSQFAGVGGVANLMLYSGVVAFLDLFSPEDQILGARDRQRSDNLGGAEILAAGPCLTASSGHCSEYGVPTRIVDTPADARREVTELAAKRPDVVKIVYDHRSSMPTVDKATLTETAATAREHGLPTVVHVGTWQDVADAVDAGATAVTHTPMGAPPSGLAERMAERGVAIIPTLVVQTEVSRFADHPGLMDDPLLAETSSAELRESYRNPSAWDDRTMAFMQWQLFARDDLGPSVLALYEAGVPIVTGTDAGNLGVFQGYSVHRELHLLVEAGLSTWAALAAATTEAGRLLGRSVGMEVGDGASFVVLDGSPIEDIANTARIYMVILNGQVIDRAELL